ncbi:Uncharacterised protein (plasmid) [Legionella adelaidensis]|uniref:Uncharacterized protein n=1 Tax=Legionella adelaidensis TaxID=45056 RepID=A0A0W0R1S4_9GAMM|nr:hypothetical protein [Legionella adelaidensis]KTC65041.1 hypothetical protein Lade_1564 [Legionella adelaidensis]VEH85440.1 Uncharacterised protein [Legionella adelaidensis]
MAYPYKERQSLLERIIGIENSSEKERALQGFIEAEEAILNEGQFKLRSQALDTARLLLISLNQEKKCIEQDASEHAVPGLEGFSI